VLCIIEWLLSWWVIFSICFLRMFWFFKTIYKSYISIISVYLWPHLSIVSNLDGLEDWTIEPILIINAWINFFENGIKLTEDEIYIIHNSQNILPVLTQHRLFLFASAQLFCNFSYCSLRSMCEHFLQIFGVLCISVCHYEYDERSLFPPTNIICVLHTWVILVMLWVQGSKGTLFIFLAQLSLLLLAQCCSNISAWHRYHFLLSY
jgi:hypothetical protein